MAEKLVLVCDVCGKTPAGTVRFQVGRRIRLKDVCEEHLAELLKGSRAPKPGRRPGAKAKAAKARTAKPQTASKRTPGRRRTKATG
ncbi:MAG TPA: hypothetical protein VE646_00685 [Actinomycetota bacterium]|nr:hypothetical protein [Actinomycetota bacterium]